MSQAPYTIVESYAARVAFESGASGRTIGYYLLEQDAKVAAEGQGWWGGPGNVEPVRLLQLPNGDTFALAYPGPVAPGTALEARDRLREHAARQRSQDLDTARAAWAKLSPRERQLLAANPAVMEKDT